MFSNHSGRYLFILMISFGGLFSCHSSVKQNYIIEGNQFAKDGLLREAADSYRRALRRNSKSMVSYRNLGMVLVKAGEFSDAIRYLDRSMARYSEDFEANFYLAEAYRASDKYADAIFHYQKSQRIKPKDDKVLKALSWSYFRIRYYSEALDTGKKILSLNPEDVQASIIVARTYLKLKRYREALRAIRKSKKSAEKHDIPYLLSVEGDIAFELGAVKRALALYKGAVKNQPLLAGALLGLGKCYLELHKEKLAITYMERALRIKPNLTESHLLLGRAYEKSSSQKAIKHYQLFKKEAASDPEYLSLLSDVKKRIKTLRKR